MLAQYVSEPVEAEPHRRQSDFVWLSSRLFTFVDGSGDSASLVLVDVTQGASAADVRHVSLDAMNIVDAAKLPTWLTPSRALEPESITLLSSSDTSVTVRLRFAAKRWIRMADVDVVVSR